MNAYNELDGVPAAADRVAHRHPGDSGDSSAAWSPTTLPSASSPTTTVSPPTLEAAAIALDAGLDVELPGTDCYGEPLLQAVRSGRVAEATVDTAVRRVLTTKFERLGLFERPIVEPGSRRCDRHAGPAPARRRDRRQVARAAAQRRHPAVASDVASIAVIGPNADRPAISSGTTPTPFMSSLCRRCCAAGNVFDIPIDEQHALDAVVIDAPSVLAELRTRFDDRVRFARGCAVNSTERTGFAEAVALAAECDVAVMVMGDKAGLTDDCTSGESRDVASLDLPGVQRRSSTPCSTPARRSCSCSSPDGRSARSCTNGTLPC